MLYSEMCPLGKDNTDYKKINGDSFNFGPDLNSSYSVLDLDALIFHLRAIFESLDVIFLLSYSINSPFSAIYVWGFFGSPRSWINNPLILLPFLSWRKIVSVSAGEINFFSFKIEAWIPDDLMSIILCLISFKDKGVINKLNTEDKRYIRKAKRRTGINNISLSDYPDAHKMINSLSFFNLFIFSKTDKNRQIGIVKSNIFGNWSADCSSLWRWRCN